MEWERCRLNSRRVAEWGVLIAALGFLALWRFHVLGTFTDGRIGYDAANYLTTMRKVFGEDFTGAGFLRPWLVGVFLKPFTVLFGDIRGVQALMAISSIAWGVPLYVTLRREVTLPGSLFGTLFAVTAPQFATFMLFSFINLIGLTFFVSTLYLFVELLDTHDRRYLFAGATSFALLIGSHQTTLVMFVIFIVPTTMLFWGKSTLEAEAIRPLLRRNGDVRITAEFVGASALLSLPFVPAYINQLQQLDGGMSARTFKNLGIILRFPHREALPFWLLMSLLAAIGLSSLYRQGSDYGQYISIASVVVAIASVLMPLIDRTFTIRFIWYRYIPISIGLAVVVALVWSYCRSTIGSEDHRRKATVGVIVTVLVLATPLASGYNELIQSGQKFHGIDDSYIETAEYVETTYQGGSVITTEKHLGWTIEGIGTTNALEIAQRRLIPFRSQQQDSLIAEAILTGPAGIYTGQGGFVATRSYTSRGPLISVNTGQFRSVARFQYPNSSIAGEGISLDGRAGNSTAIRTVFEAENASVTSRLRVEQNSVTLSVSANESVRMSLSFRLYNVAGVVPNGDNVRIRFESEQVGGQNIRIAPITVSVSSDANCDVSINRSRMTITSPATESLSITLSKSGRTKGRPTYYKARRLVQENDVRAAVVDVGERSTERGLELDLVAYLRRSSDWHQKAEIGNLLLFEPRFDN